MLQIDSSPTFTMTVKVNTRAIKGELPVTFLAKPLDELKAIEAQAQAEGKPPGDAVLAAVVRSFGDVEVGGEMLVGEKARDLARLIRWPGVGTAMSAHYWRGLYEEAEGN